MLLKEAKQILKKNGYQISAGRMSSVDKRLNAAKAAGEEIFAALDAEYADVCDVRLDPRSDKAPAVIKLRTPERKAPIVVSVYMGDTVDTVNVTVANSHLGGYMANPGKIYGTFEGSVGEVCDQLIDLLDELIDV